MISEYGAAQGRQGIALVAAFGPIELEYAAIRRSCILLDQPHRGVIEVTGPDGPEFLNRMITQEVRSPAAGHVRRGFWLNRKGRIDADLRIWRLPDRTLLDVDAHAAARTVDGLAAYIVADDVGIREISAATHRMALHGPGAAALMAGVVTDAAEAAAVAGLANDRCAVVLVGGQPVVVAREDQTGEPGLELMCSADSARGIYAGLLEVGGWTAGTEESSAAIPTATALVRPAGWHAFNVARIEAGTPLYNIDFGPDSLPAESGVFEDRVSLTKGCYLGQEIVARMHARGHPKQRLVAIKLGRDFPLPAPGEQHLASPRQPETGSPVYPAAGAAPQPGAPGSAPEPIGAVTSSAISPMLGQTPVCFAMVRYSDAQAGREVLVAAEGSLVKGTILPGLRFLPKA